MLADGSSVTLGMEGVRWARPYRSDTQQGPTPRKVTDVVQAGQQIWVRQMGDAGGWHKYRKLTRHWFPLILRMAQ